MFPDLRGVTGIKSHANLRGAKYVIDFQLSKAKFLVLEMYFIQILKIPFVAPCLTCSHKLLASDLTKDIRETD